MDKQPAHQIDSQSLDALPRSAGVYIFRGDGTLPLYIGKSVDIRSRVLSHLRTPDEAKMIAQTRRIDFIETAGQIGALLLEAQMIKTHICPLRVSFRCKAAVAHRTLPFQTSCKAWFS